MSSRKRSKVSQPDHRIGVSTISKLKSVCNVSAQSILFLLYDSIPLNNQDRPNDKNPKLGLLEYKEYHDDLVNSKSKNDSDWLHNLHTLDMTEEDNKMSC